MVAEEFLFPSARRREYIFTTFHSLFLFFSSHRLHRISTTLTARAYIRVVILTVFIIILYNFIICQFAALFPLVTSQAWLRSDVLEPQPGVTTGESRKFLALGVLGRFPAVPSASLHRLGFMSWLHWLGSSAKRPLIVILWSLPSAGYQSGLAKVRRP